MDTKNLLIGTQLLAAEILYQNYPVATKIADNAPQVFLVKNMLALGVQTRLPLAVWAVKISSTRYGALLIRSGRCINSQRINSAVFISFSEEDIIKKPMAGDFIDPFSKLELSVMGLPKIVVLVQIRNAIEAQNVMKITFSHLIFKLRNMRLVLRFFKNEKKYYWAILRDDLAFAVNINGSEALTFPLKQVLKVFSFGERINKDYRLKEIRGIPCLRKVGAIDR